MTDTTAYTATPEDRSAAREAITAARVVVEQLLRAEQPNAADIFTTALDWAVVMTDQAARLEETRTEAEQPRERPAETAAAELLLAAERLQEVLGRYRTPSWPDYSGMAPPRVAGHIAGALVFAAAAARELSDQGWIKDYTEDTDPLAPHLPELEQATTAYSKAVRELP